MKYVSIVKASCVDFEKWSTVIQFSGCIHQCEGCFSPYSWKYSNGADFTEETYVELLSYIEKPFISNLVLQGGDPMFNKNVEGVITLCGNIKKNLPSKRIVMFTGYTFEQLQSDPERSHILKVIDVLVDGKYDKNLQPAQWRGSSNQRVIDIKKTLDLNQIVEYTL